MASESLTPGENDTGSNVNANVIDGLSDLCAVALIGKASAIGRADEGMHNMARVMGKIEELAYDLIQQLDVKPGGAQVKLSQAQKGADRSGIHTTLSNKLAQLRAMLNTCHGQGFENFSSFADEIQDGFLWACSDLAAECECLVERL